MRSTDSPRLEAGWSNAALAAYLMDTSVVAQVRASLCNVWEKVVQVWRNTSTLYNRVAIEWHKRHLRCCTKGRAQPIVVLLVQRISESLLEGP